MIARTEGELNLFNRMDIARREYEALHGVGSGGDGAKERRIWKEQAKTNLRVKRKRESDDEDSTDPSTQIR